MVPREPRKKGSKQSAVVETSPDYPPVTDEEWEAFFRRSVALRTSLTEPSPAHGSKLTVVLAPEAMVPPSSPALALPPANLDALLEVDAELESAHAPPTPAEMGPGALTEQEWRERFFQRGQLTGLMEGDDLLILTAPDAAGGVASLRLNRGALATVAAAALRQDHAFDWRDHDDLVLLGIVLDGCLRGIPLDNRPAVVQHAVWGVAQRYSALVGRLAALLPPR